MKTYTVKKVTIKYISVSLVLIFSALCNVFAQPVLSASVDKSTVRIGEIFQVTYTLSGPGENFRGPDFEGFKLLADPTRYEYERTLNGVKSYLLSYIYRLQAIKEGSLKIGFATIEADGKKIQSNGLVITVVKANSSPQQPRSNLQSGNSSNTNNNISGLTEKDIFFRAELNKSSVYQGEAIIVTFKVYYKVALVTWSIFDPVLNGFWSQNIEIPYPAPKSETLVNGTRYKVSVLKKMVLFPQQSGTLYIEPVETDFLIRSNVNVDGWIYQKNVKFLAKTPKMTINVRPLPGNPPASFIGGVGNLNLDASLDKSSVNANDPLYLKIKISGNGNLKLIEPPSIEMPPEIESYDPKINENFKSDESGSSGSKVFEYLLIPRDEGTYELPTVKFSYFDLDKKQYISKSKGPFKLKVGRGINSGDRMISPSVSKSDFQLLGKDIRYIKINNEEFISVTGGFYGSAGFYALLAAPFFAFGGLVWYRNRMHAMNSDVVSLKSRKATEIARKRLSIAHKHMSSGNKGAFYEEVSKAMWGFASDKLAIPPADLSRERLSSTLQQRNVNEESVKQFLLTIDECEMARFAGASGADASAIYQHALQSISDVEQSLKS
jgi:hypothetical protein